MGNYAAPWKKYATFSGRATRGEFWTFVLINWAISVVLNQLGKNVGALEVVAIVWSLAILIPTLAVGARRLHDSGRSAGWLFLYFFIIVGWIWLLILFLLGPTPGPNKYGAQEA